MLNNRGPRQSGRRRPLPRVQVDGQWYGFGKQATDATSGWLFPERLMVEQRGFKVSYRLGDEGIDYDKSW